MDNVVHDLRVHVFSVGLAQILDKEVSEGIHNVIVSVFKVIPVEIRLILFRQERPVRYVLSQSKNKFMLLLRLLRMLFQA